MNSTSNRLFWSVFRKALFNIEAERAHDLTIQTLLFLGRRSPAFLATLSGAKKNTVSPHQVFNREFSNRVGLAAGFDKNGVLLEFLPHLGFGFAEIGTVTPRPQEGNSPPRLFRSPDQLAVFNRMGFNNDGAQMISERVKKAKEHLPETFRVGVNVGLNKETPHDQAEKDYVDALRYFQDEVDYIVINVSSPNTPGLRELQTVSKLQSILNAAHDKIAKWKSPPPLLVKLAPEIEGQKLQEIVEQEKSWGLSGWVLTNTLGGKGSDGKLGGWSGKPLQEASLKSLQSVRAISELPLISVGGILGGEDAKLRIQSGADLIQIYTGWIFGGPTFPVELSQQIS